MNDPVVWVRVPPPTFDLVGVILSSLGLAGFLALLALVLGALLGAVLVLRSRHARQEPPLFVSLNAHPERG